MNPTLLVANIASLALATYLSLAGHRVRVKIVAWLGCVVISGATIYGYREDRAAEELNVGLLGPDLSLADAVQLLGDAEEDLSGFDLVDVLGSYYTYVRRPDSVLHRFAEWVLVYRDQRRRGMREYRVSDGRLPALPQLDPKERAELSDGGFAQLIQFKIDPRALGVPHPNSFDAKDVVVLFDEGGRSLVEMWGRGPDNAMSEIVESDSVFVVSRSRIVGRATDDSDHRSVMERPDRIGHITLVRADIPIDSFHEGLRPILLSVGEYDACRRAARIGAKPIAPGKFGTAGGPGSFRLFNGPHRNLNGSYWQLPYRHGLRPILVHSGEGVVYVVDDSGNYASGS